MKTNICIKCEKPLVDSTGEWFYGCKTEQPNLIPNNNGPAYAVVCRSSGNFGSQLFDANGQIEFYLCDVCLTKAADKFLVYHIKGDDVSFFQVDRHNPARKQLVMDAYNKIVREGDTAYNFLGQPIGIIKAAT